MALAGARLAVPQTYSEHGRWIDVLIVRRFEAASVTLGVGDDNGSWYVFDQVDGEPWHRHTGPYSDMPQAIDWINAIRSTEGPADLRSALVREGHRQ